MQFTKVRVVVKSSLTMSSAITVYEHEIPILQARFGVMNVNPTEPNEGCGIDMEDKVTDKRDEHNDPIVIKVPVERSLEQEWQRLLESNQMIQVSETDKRPAALVAFPRGVLDLEDFYERLKRKQNVVPMSKHVTAEKENPPESAPAELSERDQLKESLDSMGIEFKGNASTVSLRELYEEVTNNNVSADVQN